MKQEIINKTDYKKVERLSEEILLMCSTKEITLKELQLLKIALPSAIDNKINEYMCKEKLL